jgi:hypothetical protein
MMDYGQIKVDIGKILLFRTNKTETKGFFYPKSVLAQAQGRFFYK